MMTVQLNLFGEEAINPKLIWVDYTRRNDPSTEYWANHLKEMLKSQGYPKVLMFWTKAPGTVAELYKDIVKDMQKNGTLVLAQVTYNGYGRELEPGVTPERVELKPLVDLMGPLHIRLRLNPVIAGYTTQSHIERVLEAAKEHGIKRVHTEFIRLGYKDVQYKMARFKIHESSRREKIDFLRDFVEQGRKYGVEIAGCAESNEENLYDEVEGLVKCGCSDKNWAEALKPEYKGIFRTRSCRPGCLCCYTDDWGEYSSRGAPNCPHQCLYCYAK